MKENGGSNPPPPSRAHNRRQQEFGPKRPSYSLGWGVICLEWQIGSVIHGAGKHTEDKTKSCWGSWILCSKHVRHFSRVANPKKKALLVDLIYPWKLDFACRKNTQDSILERGYNPKDFCSAQPTFTSTLQAVWWAPKGNILQVETTSNASFSSQQNDNGPNDNFPWSQLCMQRNVVENLLSKLLFCMWPTVVSVERKPEVFFCVHSKGQILVLEFGNAKAQTKAPNTAFFFNRNQLPTLL